MSQEEAEKIMERFEKWDAKHTKQDFLRRMARKLYKKERYGRR